MPSIISGYTYDIFISYRQKDNKHDGWVTNFVENLKGELESTFKEEISVYFDINPHDGLLETHDVDESLKDKLKCLIFIPIISRTYCDPNSFAWEHEFRAFIKMASEDQFGLKIKLPNGNVTGRVLPVQIHDLYPEDKATIEKEIGGILRAIEFIYKEPGVNRPLRNNEDRPNDNLNKTFYRNQINKVANAIEEVIHSLLGWQVTQKVKTLPDAQSIVKEQEKINRAQDLSGNFIGKKSKLLLTTALSVILLSAVVFSLLRITAGSKKNKEISKIEKTIAVLPFANDSPDKENEYFCNGMMEEILNQLQKIKALKVKSRTSVERYRNTGKDVKEIGRELGVSLIMEGSVRKAGDDLRITAQLIDVKSGDHLWSETYDGKNTTAIFDFQSSIAKKVASSLNVVITPQETDRLDKKPTTDIEAHDLTLKGFEMREKFIWSGDSAYARIALNLFNMALETDPENYSAIEGKASLFFHTNNNDSLKIYSEKLIKLDPENGAGWAHKSTSYMLENKTDSAILYGQKANELSPGDLNGYEYMGEIFSLYKNDVPEGLFYFQKSYDLGGNVVPYVNEFISYAFFQTGDYDKALKYMKIALSLSPECRFISSYGHMLMVSGKYNEANHFMDSICSITPCEKNCDNLRFYYYVSRKDFEKAEKLYEKSLSSHSNAIDSLDINLARIYTETGKRNKAEALLNKSIMRDKDILKASDFWLLKVSTLRLAAAYSLLGDKENALKYLSELEKTGYQEWPCSISTFPGFDNLRNDREFQSIVNKIEDQRAAVRNKITEMEAKGEINL